MKYFNRWYGCILMFFFSAVLILGGCSLSEGTENSSTGSSLGKGLRILTWNVQTLFDGNQAGTEYDEFLNEAGWAEEKFSARITAISKALSGIAEGTPDLIALEELENAGCLEALARGELSKYGYTWSFFSKNKDAALGLGVLSRFPFIKTLVHGVTWDQQTAPRPVLELWIKPEDTPLVLFVCHWKSKLGDAESTETLRRASAGIILRRVREIRKDDPGMPVIIMGDLNENHDEFYRENGKVLSALMPDDPDAMAYIKAKGGTIRVNPDNFFILSGEKPPAAEYFESSSGVFYSPWGQELLNGSYYYKSNWETIDHFLLSPELFDNTGWNFSSCLVLDREPFVNAKGIPNSYNPRTGIGLSDHLPLMLALSRH
jgi:endonuclease/exonuclease/phosphatase family metal-dependent hydrolase